MATPAPAVLAGRELGLEAMRKSLPPALYEQTVAQLRAQWAAEDAAFDPGPMPIQLPGQSRSDWQRALGRWHAEKQFARQLTDAEFADYDAGLKAQQERERSLLQKVGDAAGSVVGAVTSNVGFQLVAAAATGGLSLAAQVAGEAATGQLGKSGVSGFAKDVVTDPLKVASQIPGTVLMDLGGIGLVTTGVQATAGALGAVGVQPARDVAQVVQGARQAAKDDPLASAAIIAGTALVATGIGVAAGAGLISAGVGSGTATAAAAVQAEAEQRQQATPQQLVQQEQQPLPEPRGFFEELADWLASLFD